jgi:hypothetical protein
MVDRPVFDLSADFEADLQEALVLASRDAMKAAKLDEFVDLP